MDSGYRSLALVLSASLFVLGCSGSSSAPQSGSSEVVDTRTPEAVTTEFLEAVRTGDDKKTAALLTPSARAKTADQELVVAPPGSETAHYSIRECMLVEDDGARRVRLDRRRRRWPHAHRPHHLAIAQGAGRLANRRHGDQGL